MAPNNFPSIFPFLIDLNEDHPQQLFTYNHHHGTPEAVSSLSSHSYHNFIDTTLEGGRHYQGESFPSQHEKADMSNSPGGSCDLASTTPKNENCNVLRLSASKKEGNNEQENKSENISVKWMSSKMRLMRKMIMSSDQVAADIPEGSMQEFEDHKERSSLLQIVNSSLQDCPKSSSNTIRVCADCNTTKTPLWRSGPRGPKSLCNACGIRQRKARRAAMAAAAGGANGTLFVANTTKMKNKAQHKERKIGNKHLPFKKRCKFTATSGAAKKLCFEDLTINLNNNHSAFQRVFPQEDKEAAILLMAISQGLVHG